MTTTQAIIQHLRVLPEPAQREVLEFIKFLESRRQELIRREEDMAWSRFSLASAMHGMENEETTYTRADLKESFS